MKEAKKGLTRKQVLSIVDMREQGMTNNEIAKHFNISTKSVSDWIKKLREQGYEVKQVNKGGRPAIDLSKE